MTDYYGYENDGEEGEFGELVPVVFQDDMDKMAWARMFHQFPQEQLEILVCLYLGMKPVEIVEALEMPNILKYYNASAKLRKIFRKQKHLFLEYN